MKPDVLNGQGWLAPKSLRPSVYPPELQEKSDLKLGLPDD